MLARDHYATLGVPPTADEEEIETAYKHLSRRYHPDINPGDSYAAVVFERIEEAYRVLSDPERRERYDREGSPTEAIDEDDPELRLEVLEAGEGGSYADLFRRLREHARRSIPARGDDIHVVVDIPLAQAERGRRASVNLQRRDRCPHCDGRGRVELQRNRPCERCNGVGEETFVKGGLSVTCPCADCGGEGLQVGVACRECNGSGQQTRENAIVVRLPPGVTDGQVVRVPGEGHAGPRRGPRGDLLARVRLVETRDYERDGPHLRYRLPIGIDEAILGAKLEVPTLYGEKVGLRLPPGTQNGRVFRLRGHGLELPDGRRGDMLVAVEIRIPELVDEDSKELIRRFAERNRTRPRKDATTGA